MTDFFLDASALGKRYIAERGSTWTTNLTNPTAGDAVLVAEISLAEVAGAFASRHRAPQGITVAERDAAVSRFLQDCATGFLVLPTSRNAIDLAVTLTQLHRLRGYDAVQLAAALVANQQLVASGQSAIVFVASDRDLLAAAQAEGLAADNPLDHADPADGV